MLTRLESAGRLGLATQQALPLKIFNELDRAWRLHPSFIRILDGEPGFLSTAERKVGRLLLQTRFGTEELRP